MMTQRRSVLFHGQCGTCRESFTVRLGRRVYALRLVRALTVAHSVASPGCAGGLLEIPMLSLTGPRRGRFFTLSPGRRRRKKR